MRRMLGFNLLLTSSIIIAACHDNLAPPEVEEVCTAELAVTELLWGQPDFVVEGPGYLALQYNGYVARIEFRSSDQGCNVSRH